MEKVNEAENCCTQTISLSLGVATASSPANQFADQTMTQMPSSSPDSAQAQAQAQTKADVLAVLKKLLAAISIPGEEGRQQFASTLAPRGLAIHARGENIQYEDFPQFADRIPWDNKAKMVEGLDGEPTVLVDRDVAVVWAPYWFTYDGELSHVGTDIVTFVLRDWFGDGNVQWLVVSVADNARKPDEEDWRRLMARGL